jgi:hypothetical protein
MPQLSYDPTINLGQILTVVALLAALIATYTRIMSRIAIIESRVEDLWNNFVHQPRRRF